MTENPRSRRANNSHSGAGNSDLFARGTVSLKLFSVMPYRELQYSWVYDLKSSPEDLWPFIADTNRFNRDTGLPFVQPIENKRQRLRNARRRLRLSLFGMDIEWEEQPFEWVQPFRFGVVRTYSRGPLAHLKALAELTPIESGGTRLTYEVAIRPKSLLGAIIVPLQIRLRAARSFARAFKRYDELAPVASPTTSSGGSVELSSAARNRVAVVREKLISDGVSEVVVDRLIDFIEHADDFSVTRIRAYELADDWKLPRRHVLEACLRATRAGLLDLQWDLLCPLCRGARASESSLRDINSKLHCETCRVDFTVNFDRFVEITFRPNATLRHVENVEFCMGSPQRTPHIVAQQLLPPHSQRRLHLPLEAGRYRLRALELSGSVDLNASDSGNSTATIVAANNGWSAEQLNVVLQPSLDLENATDAEQLFMLERLAWSDQATTAAEVTALQIFRDLFSSEALRPGDQISVGRMTILFTDLRNSTRLYREIGDATAFGKVMNHFDVLKKAIAAENGALVKTIGDAIMAVFREPECALRAMFVAQREMSVPADGSPPLALKAGIHSGSCIAVTLNDRLDYFGSTVNLAARLEGLSTGDDVVVSRSVYDDPEVREMIENPANGISAVSFEMALKGFDEEQFELFRISSQRAEPIGDAAVS